VNGTSQPGCPACPCPGAMPASRCDDCCSVTPTAFTGVWSCGICGRPRETWSIAGDPDAPAPSVPPMKLQQYEWDAMITALASLAVGSAAAIHLDTDVPVVDSTGRLVATITPELAPEIIAAWHVAKISARAAA